MTEMGLCFSILLVLLFGASFKQADRAAGLPFSTPQRFRRTFDDTLVFNDCMEWVNIPRWGGFSPGWHGQKIPFPSTRSTVLLLAIKRV
jgi:hypothetical protein